MIGKKIDVGKVDCLQIKIKIKINITVSLIYKK